MAIYYAVGKHRDRCPTAGANKDGLGDCCSREKVGLYFLYRHEQLVWVHTATACAQRCTATACCTLYTRPGCALPGDTSAVLCVALRLQQQQSRWLARRMAVRSLSCALRLLVQSTKTLHLQLYAVLLHITRFAGSGSSSIFFQHLLKRTHACSVSQTNMVWRV